MKPSNVRKKSKRTAQYEKRTVTCNVGIAQCENGTIKCEKKLSHMMLESSNVIKK